MPNECTLDVSALMIGDSIRCSAITVPENVIMVTGTDEVAVAIVRPGVEEVEEEEEEGEEEVATDEKEEVAEEAV